jgi:hypothetical protein
MMIMMRSGSVAAILLAIALFISPAAAQKRKYKARGDHDSGRPVLFERKDIAKQDLYLGPGGRAMMPDLSHVVLLKEEKGGYSTKFRIRDGSGNEWVAKIGREAQPETAAVRLLAAIGYKTEINYLVPQLTIPGRGTFTNVRLEARPDHVKRGDPWNWGKTPFEGTREMQGLKLMMAFVNNWDMKSANNVIISDGRERQYVISDLGATFGKTGSNSLPLFWRFGRSRNNPGDYVKSRYITGVKKNKVKVHFNGKNRGELSDITIADARWLAGLLSQLSSSQIKDAFRAANYSDRDVERLSRAVEDRIAQLERAGSASRLANLR